ncbi:hypothetical protein [Viridibacillus arvi]|uniref:hypothetical protein n=1 Tax=Viridibacillus arvi TaxID=263475 RepID=UPI0036EE23BC
MYLFLKGTLAEQELKIIIADFSKVEGDKSKYDLILLEFIAGLFGSIGYSETLNTKKIDQNIDQLKQYDWFKNIYEDERYHRLFFVSKKVRRYLESTIRVRKIIRSKEAIDPS